MLWLKNHPHMIYSLCFVFAVSFLSLFGFVSNSSATSQTFTYDSVNNPAPTYLGVDSIGFNPHYFEFSGHSSVGDGFNPLYFIRCGYYSGDNVGTFVHSTDFYEFRSMTCYENNMNGVILFNSRLTGNTYDFTITFYDDFPDNSEPCPDCPEIPENPYDDKLDKIYNAIIIGSATMLVIYFFYVMYSWYMGGRS